MTGQSHAIFNETTFNFEMVSEGTEGAETGYAFFIKHMRFLAKAPQPKALRARNLQQLLITYQKNLTTSKLLVLPAGLRDIDLQTTRLSKDDVNKVYMSILNLSAGLVDYESSEDPLFDGIRYQIQLKIQTLFDYIEGITKGKYGFFQKHYGSRKVAYSSRNVVSTPILDADHPDDPTNLNADETMIPLLNTLKIFQPFFNHFIRNRLYGELFLHGTTEKLPVTNPKNLSIEYISIRNAELNRYRTDKGVDRLINQFKYVGFRESAVSIRDLNNKEYWLLLTYRIPGKVFISKTAEDLKAITSRHEIEFDQTIVKPLTWTEAIYLGAIYISKDKHVVMTRYPVTGDTSIFPSKVHVVSTKPSERVTVYMDSNEIDAIHYPIMGSPYQESLIVHQARLSGLNADFDGDVLSASGVWGKESNEEMDKGMNDISNIVGDNMQLKLKVNMDTVELVIHNLSI